jgi:hypothetical protein
MLRQKALDWRHLDDRLGKPEQPRMDGRRGYRSPRRRRNASLRVLGQPVKDGGQCG